MLSVTTMFVVCLTKFVIASFVHTTKLAFLQNKYATLNDDQHTHTRRFAWNFAALLAFDSQNYCTSAVVAAGIVVVVAI